MYSFFKRFFDILFSASGLLMLLPFFILVMILLKLTGEGEVFYRQSRIGYKNNRFGILKFATMLKDSVNMGGGMVTVRNDPRITPLGGFLRKYKINEIPQLWNVLTGDMSFVGPRPLPQSSVIKFEADVQSILYQNRPGITGIGSLVFRDEEKLITAWKKAGKDPLEYYKIYIYPYKGALEIWYIHNISFSTDMKILVLTFWSIVKSESGLVYKWFTKIPPKPDELHVKWIQKAREVL